MTTDTRKARQSGYMVNFDSAWKRIRRGSSALIPGSERRRSKMGGGIQNKPSMRETTMEAENKRYKPPNSRSKPAKSGDNGETVEEGLYEKLFNKLFKGDLTGKKYSDIVRTAHSICVESVEDDGERYVFVAKEEATEEMYPDRQKREMHRMILVIERLMNYFGTDNTEEDMVEFIFEFSEAFSDGLIEKRHFNLSKLFKELQFRFQSPDQSLILLKVRTVLKYLHISVIIFAIEEMRSKLDLGIEYLTKDMKDGWTIKIRLDERFLEVSHSRRECVLKQTSKENYWEIGYNVVSSFDPSMKNFSAVRLSLNHLELGDKIDGNLAAKLKKKFFDGNFIIC